jgi:hypothetical protein
MVLCRAEVYLCTIVSLRKLLLDHRKQCPFRLLRSDLLQLHAEIRINDDVVHNIH